MKILNLSDGYSRETNQGGSPSNDGLLDKIKMAAFLDVTPRTLDSWMREKRIPYYKMGRSVRFHLPTVLAYFDRNYRLNG